MMTRISILLLVLMAEIAEAQSFHLRAERAASPPHIDGILESIWHGLPAAGHFIQFQPDRGQPATIRAQAKVLYDSTHLYVAFSIQAADRPVAQLTSRDADLFSDDAVILLLDTYDDNRSAYFFMTNPLGTQTDGRISDDGRTVDLSWDAPWQCAAHVTETGWSAELAIPLTSLKYTAGDSVSWGINFGATRRSNLEISFWAGPLEHRFRVSQAGTLTGLSIAPQARRRQLIPYALSRVQENQPPHFEAGLDLRYTLTPQLSAYATLNPDFATIEADQEQINLTRFELSLAEKRQFFIEGNELFRQRIRTFYSRRIPDIRAGAKLLGRAGSWTLAALSTRSAPHRDSTEATFTVARAQKDVLGSSTVAFMLADRLHAGRHQGSAGVDATLFFSKTLGMTAQVVKSYGAFSDGTWAYFLRPAYDSPTAHFHIRYSHFGEHVAENINAVGFIRDDNRRELDSAIEKTIWFDAAPVQRLQYDSNYNIYWGQDGTLRSWQIDQGVEVELTNRLVCELAFSEEFKRYEKKFRNRRYGALLGYNTREFQSAQIGYFFGRNYDADFSLVTAEAGYKLTPQLAIEYELQHLQLCPDPHGESTWIHVIKASQFFTRDLLLRVFYQSNSAIERHNIQAVFIYRYQPPFGTVQIAYQRGTAEFGRRSQQGNTLFIKTTRVF